MNESYPVFDRISKRLEEVIANPIIKRVYDYHMSMGLFGFNIIETPYAFTREQFRFPKSKKKRIRKKWAKRECNFRDVPTIFIIKSLKELMEK